MRNIKSKNLSRERRRERNRAKIFGTAKKPRLSVFRSNKYMYAQLIDDSAGKTLLSASTRDLKSKKGKTKAEQAYLLGESMAAKARELGIKKIIFNKGPYLYHGRVKAVAEGARARGLQF